MEQMSSLGWHISDAGYALLTESGIITNTNIVVVKALNVDIKEFGDATLSTILKHNKVDKIILQIQKIRNVASPKSKEDSQFAPRMLKLILTDGHTTCPAIEISNVPFLCRSDIPPGSKLLIYGAKIASGCILLEANCCKLLGGRVPALCEKWELVKNIAHRYRSAGSDGAPPWVNFGEKIIASTSNEPFKSLAEKESKDTTNEFDLHRQDAISSATTGAVKKVFGGGTKQPVTFNRNTKQFNAHESGKPRYTRGHKGKGDANEKLEKPQKPQDKVSLFDFLEDKLPANQTENKSVNSKNPDKESTNYNNYHQKQNLSNFSVPNSKSYKDKPYNVKTTGTSYITSQPFPKIPAPANYLPSIQNQTCNQNDTQLNVLSKSISKISLYNNQFASRSFKQHLNSLANKKPTVNSSSNNDITSTYNWKIGDFCMAKYWEDGKYYNAVVRNLTQNTCVVTFNGYGNVEEVLKADCIPLDVDSSVSSNMANSTYSTDSKGSREYRSHRRPATNKPVNGGNFYNKS